MSDVAKWPADEVVRMKVGDLVPYARNARTHSPAQVDQIAASIREWGWTNPILVDESGSIIAGHGRILAAQKLGLDEVPAVTATGWTDAQKRAYVLADNQLAINAGWDADLLQVEIEGLDDLDFDLSLIGFDDESLRQINDGSFGTLGGEPDPHGDRVNYTRKVETPVYEPQGDKPTLGALYDDTRTQALLATIDNADLPEDVAEFLRLAAGRHTAFDFRNIAEYYAHAEPDLQQLMEESALVVIDFDQAIELGFVKLSQKVAEAYASEYEQQVADGDA